MTMMKIPGMFSCREVHEHVSMGTIDNLGTMARLRFRMHLLMCVHCARYVRQIRALGEHVRRLLGGEPDSERCARLEAAVMRHGDGHLH
jgi:hypothetical protein